jgi:hypothetical protein
MNDSTTSNTPATILQQAKNRALKIIEANKDCISYVRPEDLETAALFIPVVTCIKPTKDDFYDLIPGIGIMAKPPLVNLLREKAGIEILRTETEKRGEYIWHAHVYGQKRQPDGTMLPDDASYEFDAEKRAELDAINQPSKYGTDIGKRKHLLELAKFGDQRAVTGAQHSLIHKLAHVARSFKTPEELMRGMVVCRIDRNIDGILADPAMRAVALDHMLGAQEAVYGPKQIEAQNATETAPAEAAPAATPEPAEFVNDIPWEEDTPAEAARKALQGIIDRKLPEEGGWKTACELIRAMIADKGSTVEAMNNLIDRCNDYLQKVAERRPA